MKYRNAQPIVLVLIFAAVVVMALTACGSKTPSTSPAPSASEPFRYSSCDQARASAAAPLRSGQPGWNPKLDRDGDGTACEDGTATTPTPLAPAVQRLTVATPKPATGVTPKPAASTKDIVLKPVTAFGSQATVDKGKLVTWTNNPTCILAGHDSMGWAWLDNVATGRTVQVVGGPCAGRYVVYGHKHQSQKGGPIPSWMSAAGLDLVLQTCTGRSGMGFALARKV